jgi:hypothetical protein
LAIEKKLTRNIKYFSKVRCVNYIS